MSKFRWPFTLQVKATFIIVGIISTSLIAAEIVERAYVANLGKEIIGSKSVTLLRQINAGIPARAYLRNSQARERHLKELVERTPDLIYASLYEIGTQEPVMPHIVAEAGVPESITETIPEEVMEALQRQEAVSLPRRGSSSHKIKIALPLIIKGRIEGAVYAEYWTGQFDSLTGVFHRWSQVLRIGVGIVLVLSINGFLYFWVLRPLSRMSAAFTSLTHKEWDTQVPVRTKDEIGNMARNFNLMVSRIRDALKENQRLNEELIQARDALQLRVDESTAELLRRNQELASLNERLLAAQREVLQQQRLAILGQLVATIAHKVGTPLTAISGHLQLLQEDPELSEKVHARVQTLLRQTDRLSKSVQDLLSLATTPTLNKEPITPSVLIEQVVNVFRPICEKRGVTVSIECDPAAPTVLGDPAHLQEVLGNLIDNALDAMPRGGHLSLRASLLPNDEEKAGAKDLLIDVTDNGHGIPAEHGRKIFDPFYTTKPLGEGTGLGLAIAMEIVKLHNGKLLVASEEGKGTTVSIVLPGGVS